MEQLRLQILKTKRETSKKNIGIISNKVVLWAKSPSGKFLMLKIQ